MTVSATNTISRDVSESLTLVASDRKTQCHIHQDLLRARAPGLWKKLGTRSRTQSTDRCSVDASPKVLLLFGSCIYSVNVPFQRLEKQPGSTHECHHHSDSFETICKTAWTLAQEHYNSEVSAMDKSDPYMDLYRNWENAIPERCTMACIDVPLHHSLSPVNLYCFAQLYGITKLQEHAMQAFYVCIALFGRLPAWQLINTVFSKVTNNKTDKLCIFFKELFYENWDTNLALELGEHADSDIHPPFAAALVLYIAKKLDDTQESFSRFRRASYNREKRLKEELLSSESDSDSDSDSDHSTQTLATGTKCSLEEDEEEDIQGPRKAAKVELEGSP